MGTGHIDDELCASLVDLFHIANGQESAAALDAAVDALGDKCSASEAVLARLHTAALETHVDADRRRRHEAELHALLRVAQQVLASTSLSDCLDSLVSATRQLLSADVAHINLHAGQGRYDSTRAIQGEMTEAFRRQRTPPGAGLTGLVTETKSPYIATDYLSDPRIRHSPTGDASVRSDGLRTLVGVPVMHRDDVIAVLIVSYRATTSISDEQLGLLVSLATLAGLTMEDARRRDYQNEVARRIQDDSALLRARNAQLTWAATCYADLMELVLLRRGIDAIVDAISNAFNCPAGVLDAEGILVAPAEDSGGPTLCVPDGVVEHLGSAQMEFGVFNIHHDKNSFWYCPVSYEDEVLGATFVCREALDEVEQLALTRIGQLVGQTLRDSKYGTASGELGYGTVASLLDGRAQDDYTADLSHALGSSTTKPLIALVAIGDPSQQLRMHHFGVRIAHDHSGVAGSQDGRLVIILPGTDASSAAKAVEARLAASLASPVWIGAARSDEPRGLAVATAEALRCARCLQRIGRGQGGSATVQSLGQIGLLLGGESEETVGEFIRASIGPLIEYDQARRSELVRTLEAYLTHNSSLKAAASKLHVHPNTVLQRLQKVSILLGEDDWRSRSEKRLDLQLALRLHSLSPTALDGRQ